MSTTIEPAAAYAATPGGRQARRRRRRKKADSFADGLLYGLCAFAALIGVVLLFVIGFQVVHSAAPAISKFGLGFLVHTTWAPNFEEFGAGSFLLGTAVTSFMALLLGAPIAISIGLYLSLLAPGGVRGIVSPLVEMLAAIPSRDPRLLGSLGARPLRPRTPRALAPRNARASSRSSAPRRRPAPASSRRV